MVIFQDLNQGEDGKPYVPEVINCVFHYGHLQEIPALEFWTPEQLLIKWHFVLTPFFLIHITCQGKLWKEVLSGQNWASLGIRTIMPY